MDTNSLLLLNNRIYVPSVGNLCTCVLQYNHDHILTGHFGQNKTLELVCYRYFWPSLHADVQQFCKSCVTCMKSKPQHHKPYQSLKQLPIPKRPWNSISIDFIEKLSSSSRFNTILVIVDQLTKQVIFTPAHDIITSTDLTCCDNHLSQGQMITQGVNLLVRVSSGEFTRELDKEPLLN